MRIDAHQHFWSLKRPNDYGFLTPDAGVLYKDYLPRDLAPLLKKSGIDRTILVQAAETTGETEWLLAIADRFDFVAGVVGWINVDSDKREFSEQLQDFRTNKKFVGLRPMLQGLPDDDFILRPRVLKNLELLAELDFPFELLVYPRHLPHVHEMLRRVPGLRAVIDHLAKPSIRTQEIDFWNQWMTKIALYPNVWCKLSGMVTEADHQHWKPIDFLPYIESVVSTFGTGRIMFGSDWPVCLLAASYEQVLGLVREVFEMMKRPPDREEINAIMGVNAEKFYKLDNGPAY